MGTVTPCLSVFELAQEDAQTLSCPNNFAFLSSNRLLVLAILVHDLVIDLNFVNVEKTLSRSQC